MMKAIERGDKRSVVLFLSQGYDPNLMDSKGLTPLNKACVNGHLSIAQELVAREPTSTFLTKKAFLLS